MAAEQEWIVWRLPLELRLPIIESLGMADRTRCMRVSKSWYSKMINPAYWTSLDMTKFISRRRMGAVRVSKPLEYAQEGLRHIKIKQFPILCEKIMRCLGTGPAGHQLRSLSLIRLLHHDSQLNQLDRLNKGSLDFCANTIEILELGNWDRICLPEELPVLKALKLVDTELAYIRHDFDAQCPQLRILDRTITNLPHENFRDDSLRFALTSSTALTIRYSLHLFCGCKFGRGDVRLERLPKSNAAKLKELDVYVEDCDYHLTEERRRGEREVERRDKVSWILRCYGRMLTLLTLRNVSITPELLEIVERFCPDLNEIRVIEACDAGDIMAIQRPQINNTWGEWEVEDRGERFSYSPKYCEMSSRLRLQLIRNNLTKGGLGDGRRTLRYCSSLLRS